MNHLLTNNERNLLKFFAYESVHGEDKTREVSLSTKSKMYRLAEAPKDELLVVIQDSGVMPTLVRTRENMSALLLGSVLVLPTEETLTRLLPTYGVEREDSVRYIYGEYVIARDLKAAHKPVVVDTCSLMKFNEHSNGILVVPLKELEYNSETLFNTTFCIEELFGISPTAWR